MAKQIYSDFALDEKLQQLEGDFRRKVTRKMLEAGAKVIAKEMQSAIETSHHVVSGEMLRGVAPTEIREDIGTSSVEVYTQGVDSRGVKNEMKNVIISQGYYYKGANSKRKPDRYLKGMRKKVEPRVQAVMNYAMQEALKENGIIE